MPSPLAIGLLAVSAVALVIWCVLVFARAGYWRLRERLEPGGDRAPDSWPLVTAVVPARDEADVIGRTLASIAAQDYQGELRIVLVDDQSGDETAAVARVAAPDAEILRAPARPAGWAPKVWAMTHGFERAVLVRPADDREYVWLTDADIEHDPAVLRTLVAKAEAEQLDQVSCMVELASEGFFERLLIPVFVLFFAKLYPFARVNSRASATAAAAGGCVLASRTALERGGGTGRHALDAIRGALIDDCALARELACAARERGRGLWLGVSRSSRSVRPYGGLAGVWRMVARSAYTQLDHSPWRLVGTVFGMALLYLAPPSIAAGALVAVAIGGDGWFALAALVAGAAFALQMLTAVPVLRLYRQPLWMASLLPLAGLLYTMMTVDSARAWARGAGGQWKGRVLGGEGPANA